MKSSMQKDRKNLTAMYEAVTDLEGRALATVGEANKYWYAVMSPIGDAPGGGGLWTGPTWTEPGEVYELTVKLYPTSNVFNKGHRIRVDVSSSNFPRSSRWDFPRERLKNPRNG